MRGGYWASIARGLAVWCRERNPKITATLIMLTFTPTAASHALAGRKNAAEKLHLD